MSLPTNKLIVVTAPSGSGKTTIVKHLLAKYHSLAFSVSATTRDKREHEEHGTHYYFLSTQTFRKWAADNVFVEWEEVYHDQFYGTPRFEIARLWDAGKTVVFDIDVKGAANLKRQFGEKAHVIFVQAPSMEVIIERLKGRQTETEQSLQKRIQRIEAEMRFAEIADHVLVNDDLETAFKEAERIIDGILGP